MHAVLLLRTPTLPGMCLVQDLATPSILRERETYKSYNKLILCNTSQTQFIFLITKRILTNIQVYAKFFRKVILLDHYLIIPHDARNHSHFINEEINVVSTLTHVESKANLRFALRSDWLQSSYFFSLTSLQKEVELGRYDAVWIPNVKPPGFQDL